MYNYEKFLSDSSDDHPKYADGIDIELDRFRILTCKVLEGDATENECNEHQRTMLASEKFQNEFIEMEEDYKFALKCVPYIVEINKEEKQK